MKRVFKVVGISIAIWVIIMIMPYLFLGCLLALPEEERANNEEITEIMNSEFENKSIKDSINKYIELIDFIEKNQKEILKQYASKDTSGCSKLFRDDIFPSELNIPSNLYNTYNKLVSKHSYKDFTMKICVNGNIVLYLSYQRNYKKYVDISHFLAIGELKTGSYFNREWLINKKYHYLVSVEDVFDNVQPNDLF